MVLIERALGAPNESAAAKLSDLNMLVAPGGRERTTDEYSALFGAAGLRFTREVQAEGDWSVFEAVAE